MIKDVESVRDGNGSTTDDSNEAGPQRRAKKATRDPRRYAGSVFDALSRMRLQT